MISSEILNRKGATKAERIPKEIIELLNSGEIETVNLTEWLQVDQVFLLKNLLKEMNKEIYLELILTDIINSKKQSTVALIGIIGRRMSQLSHEDNQWEENLQILSNHKSDTVRCWATYFSINNKATFEENLEKIKFFAADHHFGVREIAWMAIRPEIDKNLEKSIEILSNLTKDNDENIRRFASEATRPRGVWCKHIEILKANPALGLPILEPLKSDGSKYVQDSVSNWLNDASKTQPNWVIEICNQWKEESPIKHTERIIKRGLRSINKE